MVFEDIFILYPKLDRMSQESEDEDAYCFLDVELEALHSIYINELEVTHDEGKLTTVTIHLHPSTADNVEEQYVRLSLIFNIPVEYPDKVPEILIRNPRGLSDEKLGRVAEDLVTIAEERKGGTMLFELIECAKDHLTAGNRPSCQCAICLHGFTEEDIFTKTKCYHYFHSHCLSRYVRHQFQACQKVGSQNEREDCAQEVLCPVCRVSIDFDVVGGNFPPPCSTKEDNFVLSDELRILQEQMKNLFEKQKAQGGIIDIEAEKNKFLLEISTVPSLVSTQDPECEEKASFLTCDTQDENVVSTENNLKDSVLLPKTSKAENLTQNGFNDKDSNCPYKNRQRDTKNQYVKQLDFKSKKQYERVNRSSNNEKNSDESVAFRQAGTNAESKRLSSVRYSRNILNVKFIGSQHISDSNENNLQGNKGGNSENEFEINKEPGKSTVLQEDSSITSEGKLQQKRYSNSYKYQNQFHQNRNLRQNYNQRRDFPRQGNKNSPRHNFRNYNGPISMHQNSDCQNLLSMTENECKNSRQSFRGKPRYRPSGKHFGENKDNGPNHQDQSNKGPYYYKKDLYDSDKIEDSGNNRSLAASENIPFSENLKTESRTNSKNMLPEKSHERFSKGEQDLGSREMCNYDQEQHKHEFRGNYVNRKYPVNNKKAFTSKVEHNIQSGKQDHSKKYEFRNKPFNRPYNESSWNPYGNKKNYRNAIEPPELIDSFQNSVTPTHKQKAPQKSCPSKGAGSQDYNLQSMMEGCEHKKGKNYVVPNGTNSISSFVPPPPPGFAKKVVYGLPSIKPPPGFDRS